MEHLSAIVRAFMSVRLFWRSSSDVTRRRSAMGDGHRWMRGFAAFAIFWLVTTVCADASVSYLEDNPGFTQLGWATGSRQLAQSHGILTVPPQARGLFDSDDLYAVGRLCGCPPDVDEGFVRFYRSAKLEYRYSGEGYVGDRDWGTLDPWFLLQSIRTQAHELVGTRYTTIYGSTNILGWGALPSYDKRRHVVTFMVHTIQDDGRDRYDARALVLGRYGYETILADTHSGSESSTWLDLQRGIASYRFPAGYRYADHQPTDQSGYIPISLLLEMHSGAKLTQVPSPAQHAYRMQALFDVCCALVSMLLLVAISVVVIRRELRRARA